MVVHPLVEPAHVARHDGLVRRKHGPLKVGDGEGARGVGGRALRKVELHRGRGREGCEV